MTRHRTGHVRQMKKGRFRNMKSCRFTGLCQFLGVVFLCCQLQAQTSLKLTLLKTIPLAEYTGSFDHFAFDETRGLIFLAAEDQGTVEVLDLHNGTHLRTITGFTKPHSILVRPGAATILVTDSGASKSALLSASTYKRIKSLKLALGANCLLYDAQRNRAYVTAGGDRVHLSDSSLLAVNPDTGIVLKLVFIPSIHLQPMAFDPVTNRLFPNMADKDTIAVLDGDSLRMIAEWKINVAKGNSPIAFDSAHHRIFVVCDDPGVLVVLNSETGRITNAISVPADADDMDFDASSHRLYIPGGDGFLGVYDTRDADRVTQIARIVTHKGAKTGLLIPSEHKYIVAAPASGKNAAEVMVFNIH